MEQMTHSGDELLPPVAVDTEKKKAPATGPEDLSSMGASREALLIQILQRRVAYLFGERFLETPVFIEELPKLLRAISMSGKNLEPLSDKAMELGIEVLILFHSDNLALFDELRKAALPGKEQA